MGLDSPNFLSESTPPPPGPSTWVRSDRTVAALLEFSKRKLELEGQYKQWPEARKAHAANWNPDHPGCMLVGFIMVRRSSL